MTKLVFIIMVAFLKWLRKQDGFLNWLEAVQFANRHNPDCPQFDVRGKTDNLIARAERFV